MFSLIYLYEEAVKETLQVQINKYPFIQNVKKCIKNVIYI